jgi:hypothetical protein
VTLSERMRDAADTIEELSAYYGYFHPDTVAWSADELRHESRTLEGKEPNNNE